MAVWSVRYCCLGEESLTCTGHLPKAVGNHFFSAYCIRVSIFYSNFRYFFSNSLVAWLSSVNFICGYFLWCSIFSGKNEVYFHI